MRVLRLSFPPLLTIFLAMLLWYQAGLFQQVSLTVLHDKTKTQSVKQNAVIGAETAFDLPEPFAPSDGLAILFDRPLFSETRRRPVIIQKVEEPVVKPQPEVKVEVSKVVPLLSEPEHIFRGVFGQGDELSALLFNPETEVEIWVKTGEIVAGWNVQEITPDYIKFVNNEREYIVKLIP